MNFSPNWKAWFQVATAVSGGAVIVSGVLATLGTINPGFLVASVIATSISTGAKNLCSYLQETGLSNQGPK